jgi:hypothetical protein
MNRVMNAIIQVAFDREMDLHVSVVIIGWCNEQDTRSVKVEDIPRLHVWAKPIAIFEAKRQLFWIISNYLHIFDFDEGQGEQYGGLHSQVLEAVVSTKAVTWPALLIWTNIQDRMEYIHWSWRQW